MYLNEAERANYDIYDAFQLKKNQRCRRWNNAQSAWCAAWANTSPGDVSWQERCCLWEDVLDGELFNCSFSCLYSCPSHLADVTKRRDRRGVVIACGAPDSRKPQPRSVGMRVPSGPDPFNNSLPALFARVQKSTVPQLDNVCETVGATRPGVANVL